MNRSEAKKKARLGILASILMLIAAAAVFMSSTYGWIKRQWTPSVEGHNLRIEASGALAFELSDKGVKDQVDLSSQMGRDFVLSPVSNCSGESDDFFTLVRNTELQSGYYYDHIECLDPAEEAEGWQKSGIKYGYIEQSFRILYNSGEEGSTDYVKFIYLDPEKTHLTNVFAGKDPASAARISITVDQSDASGNGTTTYILGSETKTSEAITNDTYIAQSGEYKGLEVWKADGKSYYNPGGSGETYEVRTRFDDPEHTGTSIPLTETVSVQRLDYYTGGITGETGNRHVDPEKCLFRMSSGAQVKNVTVRVWLEGCDRLCDDSIAGLQLDMCLSFAASNCVAEKNGSDYVYRIIEHDAE